jgi:2-C-methyl-D-erythritol 2,4-cyclodiphosphate synthase
MSGFRVGHGFDVHSLGIGRPLVLGGVRIPFIKGLLGHSDADALAHAICDAILGAAGLPDIGAQFPDTDPQYAGANSLELLRRCVELADEAGWCVVNIDATIIAEEPKMRPHIEKMRAALAPVLSTDGTAVQVNVKAKTSEGMGLVGRGEGIEAHAVALLAAKPA